jgi:hypothetical protein
MRLRKRFGITYFVAVAAAAFFLGVSLAYGQTCGTTTWDLTAGQYNDVGSVVVSNDMDNLYITYTLNSEGATLGNLHAWVGNDLTSVPSNRQGIPVPGQFCNALGGRCYDASGLTTYTFTIPFSELNIADASAACKSTFEVVTHAEVKMPGGGTETAFGGDTPGSGTRWWYYGTYTICCDFGPPPECFYKTAFAKGNWVWTTDKKSNPENLSSLRLTKNRWGWAINLTATGQTSYDIWAGAGLNDTAKGVKVGTLTVNWTGTNAVVTYTMLSGYYLKEVHLYAADARPATTAPGQYGNLDSFEGAGASIYTFNVPLADTNAMDGVWLIAHAVVSNGYCQ